MADAGVPAVAAPGGVVDGGAAPVVAPVVAPRDPMDQYLEDVIGMTRPGMRQHIIRAGFTNLQDLVGKDKHFANDACEKVRKA